ncbi:MAG: beta-propeller domain-containing protein [Deltaproteobacteria bacterium]|nr:beta-propeller domain-containing protein [Deltaproteobacteria bacterium]
MKPRILTALPYVLLVVAAACGDSKPETDPNRQPGATDFVTDEVEGSNFSRGAKGEAANDSAGAPPAATSAPGAPMGRTGEVQEGDIYRISDNHLFYLNTYRGFVIYDVSDPKRPARVSRLPVFGYPVEMFVEGNTVYALLRDALYLTQDKGAFKFERHNVSQLVSIDITDLKNPKVLKTVDIVGELREGVSRKIENTIYVVSSVPQYYSWGWNYGPKDPAQKEQAWVYSFNVANPQDLKLVQQLKVFEGGSINFNDPKLGVSLSRNFQSVSISATANALMVVENWHVWSSANTNSPDGKQYRCGSYASDQQAIVSLIDISDPSGAIRLHSKFETAGHLTDQFKMTYNYDAQTKAATFFGIFARQAWSGANCSGTSIIQNTIESWDVTNGGAPVRLAALDFGKPNETVRGSAFDIERKVAYAITARQIDPLYVIGLADPKNLKVLSSIDGLSGDMNVFRLVADKNFLMGIGRDASNTCTGQQDTDQWRPTQVAVSLIDVRDLNAIKLVQRRCVAIEGGADWVGSDVNWNLDQAHKMLGMHSDGKVNVVTVPVYYSKRDSENDWWWYKWETAVGIMAWDVSKYDPAKAPAQQTVLQNYGTVVHPNGEVRRSIVFTHKGATERRMMINLSDTHISMTDIEDLSKPVRQSDVELAPYYSQIFKFGDYVVEHIQQTPYSGWGPNQGGSEFRIKAVGGDLEATPAVATFKLGQITRVIKHGNKLVLFRSIWSQQKNPNTFVPPSNEALVMDLTDPTKPVPAGTVALPQNIQPEYRFWCGLGGYWGGYWFDQSYNWVSTDSALVFMQSDWDQTTQKPRVRLDVVDLSVAGKPTFAQVDLPGNVWEGLYGLVGDTVDPKGFYLAYRTAVSTYTKNKQMFTQYRYYAQRWDKQTGAWAGAAPVNLPGRLVRTWSHTTGSRLFLTQDNVYKEVAVPASAGGQGTYWQSDYRLNLLRSLGPKAELLDTHHFVDLYLRDLVPDGDKLYVNGGPNYYGGFYGGGVADVARPGGVAFATTQGDWEDYSDRFMIFDLSKLTLAKAYDQATATYNAQLMGVYQGKLFVNLPGDGILVVDASNPAQPMGQQFMRTLGYASHIEFAGDSAYVASGYFGVYQMKLTTAPLLTQD